MLTIERLYSAFTSVGVYMFEVVKRQRYEEAYILQAIPGLGPIISVPTALVSGVKAIEKVVQSALHESQDYSSFYQQEAKDLSVIFANNVLNICTLGVLNNIFVCVVLSNIRVAHGEEDD